MLAPESTVIWTRGWFAGDEMRPTMRSWFVETGLDEISFDREPFGYGVGVARWAGGTVRSAPPPARLFSFVR
jgi:hypothetical protein